MEPPKAEIKNVFISHAHADDELVHKLKELIQRSGIVVRDGSIMQNQETGATDEQSIKQYLKARIDWASTLVVLITSDAAASEWVNWEIKHAVEHGKNVVGVYARGATDADIPEELRKCGDACLVGWLGERIADAICE